MKLALPKPDIAKAAVAIAVALAALAGVVTGREKPAPAVVESKAPAIEQAATVAEIDRVKLSRAQPSVPRNDPFAPRSFAPPKQRVSAPADAPRTPPLPFRYIGRLTANGKTEIFVMRGEELISIAAGQNIDGDYRVDAITESSIAFTYLPLRTRQSIDLAEASG